MAEIKKQSALVLFSCAVLLVCVDVMAIWNMILCVQKELMDLMAVWLVFSAISVFTSIYFADGEGYIDKWNNTIEMFALFLKDPSKLVVTRQMFHMGGMMFFVTAGALYLAW